MLDVPVCVHYTLLRSYVVQDRLDCVMECRRGASLDQECTAVQYDDEGGAAGVAGGAGAGGTCILWKMEASPESSLPPPSLHSMFLQEVDIQPGEVLQINQTCVKGHLVY